MQSSLYVALSSQIALENRLTTIADNVANSSTIGFRPTEIRFSSLLGDGTAYVSEGETYLSSTGGGLTQTGSMSPVGSGLRYGQTPQMALYPKAPRKAGNSYSLWTDTQSDLFKDARAMS